MLLDVLDWPIIGPVRWKYSASHIGSRTRLPWRLFVALSFAVLAGHPVVTYWMGARRATAVLRMIESGHAVREIEARYPPDSVIKDGLESHTFGISSYLGIQLPDSLVCTTSISFFGSQEFSYGHGGPLRRPVFAFYDGTH